MNKIRVVIDVSNIKVGGGIQVALSFINYLLEEQQQKIHFHFVLSTKVFEQIKNKEQLVNYNVINTGFWTLNPFSKSRTLFRSVIRDADLVFTLFGPSFWGNCNKHLVGFANAWIVTPNTHAYYKYPPIKRLIVRLKNYVLGKLLYTGKRFYVTETKDIKDKFLNYFGANEEQIKVVPNSLPYMYSNEPISIDVGLPSLKEHYKFLTISANYPHKNLSVIEDVGHELFKKNLKFIFFVTMTEEAYKSSSNSFKKYTYNLGVIDVEECPSYYASADALFLPTLLECFSVSYLEAMFCKLPIATSNYDFAKEICGDAAIYFNPLSPLDIAEKLETLITNKKINNELVDNGKLRLAHHINNEERSKMYLNILLDLGSNDVQR